MKKILLAAFFCTMVCLGADTTPNWQQILAERIPAYGHRNWIVVADSAYPAQAREGIETIVADADQVQVLQVVLAALGEIAARDANRSYRPGTEFLDDGQAPGVEVYRDKLGAMFKDKPVESLPHEQIIEKLDEVSKTFRVLIIKTNMTLPYTTVFLQLDCAYWGPDAEKGLRAKMAAAGVR